MANQKSLSYSETGEGEALVLIHGFCETREIWESFIPSLSENNRVIALDLPGFGESIESLITNTTLTQIAGQVKDLLASLGVKKCIMIGHSLGGYISLAFAENYPEMLSGLVLFHSTALPDTEEKRKTRNNVIDFVEKNGVAPFIENFVAPLFYEKRKNQLSEAIQKVKYIALKTPQRTLIEITKAMRNRKNRISVLQNTTYPVMFIIGRQDTAVPFESYIKQIELPKNCTIHILDETGHMGMYEKPKETLSLIKSFVSLIFQK